MMEGTTGEARICGARKETPLRSPSSRPPARTAEQPLLFDKSPSIVILSTFTAAPLQAPLEFWMCTLGVSAGVCFAPYGQIMQELLGASSCCRRNIGGFNILLMRFEDLIRDLPFNEDTVSPPEQVRRGAEEVLGAVRVLQASTSAPLLVFLCPFSAALPDTWKRSLEEIQHNFLIGLNAITGVQCLRHEELIQLYPTSNYEDARADRLAHIPYTESYFVALGTLLARRIARQLAPQYKVIALDCDNTLWKGVCGEDGSACVELTPAHLQFHDLLLRQRDAGMLLCLCSKNNPADVEAVFRGRPEMRLCAEHIIASRLNWNSKSSNLQSLAQELNLSLDSFIFIDDNPVECAEVQANCQSVLTLRFPGTPEDIARFSNHIWAFDLLRVTDEAKNRNAQYKQNQLRESALEQAPSLAAFLASLQLEVAVTTMQAVHLDRVAELIQRTTQFNLTAILRRAGEIQSLCDSNCLRCCVVHVRDRFGDYGIVGVLLFRFTQSSIDVDTFALSCRVLGRGVEHQVINELARIGQQQGLEKLVLRYRQTSRNRPALQFLKEYFAEFESETPSADDALYELSYTIPMEYARSLRIQTSNLTTPPSRAVSAAPVDSGRSAEATKWNEIGYRLSRLSDIESEIDGDRAKVARDAKEYTAPKTSLEAAIASIWAEVLWLDRAGRHDKFFELGGDSFLAVQALARIGSTLSVELSLRDLFDGITLEQFAQRVAIAMESKPPAVPEPLVRLGIDSINPQTLPLLELDPSQIERIVQLVPGGAENIADIYPLAPLQEGILFHHLLNEHGGDTYVLPTLLCVSAREHLDALISALQKVIERHDVLRSAVLWEQLSQPVNVVYRRAVMPVDHSVLDPSRSITEQLDELIRPENQRLDLRRAPLMRLRVTADPNSAQWYALLQLHHIIVDHDSIKVVIAEVMSFLNGRAENLPEPVPYRDHVARMLAQGRSVNVEEFFRKKLRDIDSPTAPFGLMDVHGDGTRIEGASQLLELGFARRVRALARRLGVSAATLFHVACGLVAAHTSGRADVVYGTVLSGRPIASAGTKCMLGMFINTLPLRLRLAGVTALDLVRQTQRELAELLDYDHTSLAQAQRCSGIGSSEPLFSILLNYRHSAPNPETDWTSATGVRVLATEEWTNYPITLSIDDLGEGFTLTAQTDQGIRPQRMIGYLREAMQSLVSTLERSPQSLALTLSILPEHERRQVIELFNTTRMEYPERHLVHELFEEQVELTPEAVAVVYDEQSLTYAELNVRANQLARYLREKGVGPEKLVGICVERSLQMVVGLLGILKAGAAYVPLDPSYPSERLRRMLRDAAPKVLLIQERLRSSLPETTAEVVELDQKLKEIANEDARNLKSVDLGLSACGLVYVIYTSGSTGLPKGVAMAHHSMGNLINWHRKAFCMGEPRRVLQFAALSFDVAFQETFSTLCTGGTLLLVDEWVRKDVRELMGILRTRSIDTLFVPPLMLQSLADNCHEIGAPPGGLQNIIAAGEQLRVTSEVARFVERFDGCQLHNHYGPTESHVVTSLTLTGDPSKWPTLPSIGRPLSNTQMYVLDSHRQPVPIGVVGEIYIGGAGVARGYLNRPEVTAERFVADPFGDDVRARLYKTGDLGRWQADGTIEYVGRNDGQLKIRGFRIELGEIESQLARHPQIKEAVVLSREDVPDQKRLVAYVISRDLAGSRAVLTAEELREHLKPVLPEYMVPAAFVTLESFPLTPNGKLDRLALPVPEMGAYVSRRYEAPQGEVEEILAEIWRGILRVERVGRWDNFFELGGHSLLVVQVMERLRRVGLCTEVRRVFESPTMAELASEITTQAGGTFEVPASLIPSDCRMITPSMLPLVELTAAHIGKIVRVVTGGVANIEDIYPLAPLQEGILFHHLLNSEGGDVYARAMLFSLSSRERLNEFIAALQAVVDRHDVLRTAVLWEELPRPVQVVLRRTTLPVEVLTLDQSRDPVSQLKERMSPEQQRLDLREAPMMKLLVADDPGSMQWYALLQTHHLVCDNESLDIMVGEVLDHLGGRAQALPEPLAYRAHVAQVLAHARTDDAEEFFRSKFGEIDEPTAPFGLLDVRGDGSQIDEAHEDLSAALSQRVRHQARRLSVSAATLFHAAWGLVVGRLTAREDVVFGTVLLGRLQGAAGAQRILGMFINTLPLRLRLKNITTRELVEQTQRELVELLSHEQASLAVAQRSSGIAGSMPLFTTLLNYRHSANNLGTAWSNADGLTLLASQGGTNYPISLSVDDMTEGFALKAQTNRRIDPHRILGYLNTALESLVVALGEAPQTPALALPILPELERRQLFELSNSVDTTYPCHKLIHESFEEQAVRTPEAIAVTYEGRSLTYSQLNSQSNRLARYLRQKGVSPDKLVCICIERGLEMLVGLLGTLKSGGAYVPLDPKYPAERLGYMLKDAAPSVLLILERLRNKLPHTNAQIVSLDAERYEIEAEYSGNLDPKAIGLRSNNLAYAIYTSGSSGPPKCVLVEHGNLTVSNFARTRFYGSCPRFLLISSFAFDSSIAGIFGTLVTGGELTIATSNSVSDPTELLATIQDRGITDLLCVPSLYQSILEFVRSGSQLKSLARVIVAGEACTVSLLDSSAKRAPSVQLFNEYGPTEATIWATVFTCAFDSSDSDVPIGRPIDTTRLYILDAQYQPVPIGVPGEIYIGGAGVARGYLNLAEMTAQRFLPDPFADDTQARIYKTGDLGRWRKDGNVEFLGRYDNQVKIRGYRIELGEIESHLFRHPQVDQAAVLAREYVLGERRLVAYVTLKRSSPDGVALGVEQLRGHLKAVLPEQSVPSAFVFLKNMPLTPNGKLDRAALPAPDPTAYSSQNYEAPNGDLEEALAGIWRTLLHVERIGRQDNFFDLGGHSLLATRVISSARELLEIDIPVRALFDAPTLRELAIRVHAEEQAQVNRRALHGGHLAQDLREAISEMDDDAVRVRIADLERSLGCERDNDLQRVGKV